MNKRVIHNKSLYHIRLSLSAVSFCYPHMETVGNKRKRVSKKRGLLKGPRFDETVSLTSELYTRVNFLFVFPQAMQLALFYMPE